VKSTMNLRKQEGEGKKTTGERKIFFTGPKMGKGEGGLPRMFVTKRGLRKSCFREEKSSRRKEREPIETGMGMCPRCTIKEEY